MSLFKKNLHDFGKSIGTVPDVRQCKKCGKYEEIPGTRGMILDDFGTANLGDLPLEISGNMVNSSECKALPVYTAFQYDDAVSRAQYRGWSDGQAHGIHLQPEFTRQFFSKIRLNPNTLVYEIPKESYEVLKDMLADQQHVTSKGNTHEDN